VSVVLTEFIPGPPDSFSSYYTYLDESGTPLLQVTKRKLRQYPLGFGEGTYHLVSHEPEVAEVGLRFFRGVGYRGLGNVEFRRDDRDAQWKVIECNPRFTAANELIQHAGVDLVAFTYCRLAGLPAETPGDFRDGLSIWLPVNDWRAFREHRRRGELTTFTWLRQVARWHAPAVVDRSDPVPALARLAQRVGGLVRRLAGRAGRS
jgi:predicted ATP-grasp superfamily ATP-dependent carboligase